VARVKKIAARQGRVIVFIDESGLSERPCRARTWAPKGETPVLQYRFSWKQLSVIAGISYWRFYFHLFNGSIKSPQIVEFLKALQTTIGKKLLIIWDGLQAHRSKLVRAHVEAQRGRIVIERLPAYAPEMNPVECIWGYLKHQFDEDTDRLAIKLCHRNDESSQSGVKEALLEKSGIAINVVPLLRYYNFRVPKAKMVMPVTFESDLVVVELKGLREAAEPSGQKSVTGEREDFDDDIPF
jgi:transposase